MWILDGVIQENHRDGQVIDKDGVLYTDRLIKYKPNTLEMDYTYEIHEEPNLGLTIDLIDPAKYEGTTLNGVARDQCILLIVVWCYCVFVL